MLEKEALKFKKRAEFAKKSNSAYLIAANRDILDEICAHMDYDNHPWSIMELKKIADKYDDYYDLIRNDSAAYNAIRRRGLLKDLCSNLKKTSDSSKPEISLFDQIKLIFPKTQKMQDNGVKIEGRPHIHRFHIDIYIPELRRGIEFDGKYWHSFSGLKRGRPNWPDEDLRDYASLKDTWFASKGIQILHIKEEDWNLDKEDCVTRCLKFLGIKETESKAV
jgi:very-short-patch-repair endonuclease